MTKLNTPEQIAGLPENNYFVFGSNLEGKHYGGAARFAVEKFGAELGNAEGLQGQSYAIPTVGEKFGKMTLEEIEKKVDTFLKVAEENPEKTFWVTKIGCGIAGFTLEEMGDMFRSKTIPENVILPIEFC